MNLDALAEAVIGGILSGGITGTVAYLPGQAVRIARTPALRYAKSPTSGTASVSRRDWYHPATRS